MKLQGSSHESTQTWWSYVSTSVVIAAFLSEATFACNGFCRNRIRCAVVACCPFRPRLVRTWIPLSCPNILEMQLSFFGSPAPAILNAHNLCEMWYRMLGVWSRDIVRSAFRPGRWCWWWLFTAWIGAWRCFPWKAMCTKIGDLWHPVYGMDRKGGGWAGVRLSKRLSGLFEGSLVSSSFAIRFFCSLCHLSFFCLDCAMMYLATWPLLLATGMTCWCARSY